MKKHRILTVVITLLLIIFSAACVYAVDEQATAAADVLYKLGLFAGTGTNADGIPIYSLDRQLNRQEAMTLFVNLLGKADEAMAGTWTTPFTDVDEWAKPFVGYAYENDFTAGVAADRFGAHDPVTESQYLTYLLLALGYEQGTDFNWNESYLFASEIGFNDRLFVGGPFYRSSAVLCNCNALALPKKGSEECLIGKFEGKPADAAFIAAHSGFLFAWNEGEKSIVAQYGTDLNLIVRYEAERVESRYDDRTQIHALLQRYDIGDGRSFGYYCGMAGVYRMQGETLEQPNASPGMYRIPAGTLQQLSARPVAQMVFLRYGPVSSGPIILTFSPKAPVYSEYRLFGGDTIIEIKEDGSEDVFLHGDMGHGIEIDEIHRMDSVVSFNAVDRVGMEDYRGYDYFLERKTDAATGEYKPQILVSSYTPGPEEAGLEPGTDAYDKYTHKMRYAEQKRLKELGFWDYELPPEE